MEHFLRLHQYSLPTRIAVQLAVTALWLVTGHAVWADRLPERLTAAAPMAIGNTVFHDYNRNGNQDSGEPGIANIPLRLFQNGTEQRQTLTDNNGQFLFTNANVPGGIRPNTAYDIRIAVADFPAGLSLTRSGTSTPGNNAQLVGSNAVVFVTTTATAAVTVNPSVTATLSSATICNGTSATLVASGGTGYSLTPGGLTSTDGIFIVSPLVTTAYSVSVTDANGSSATATAAVTVNPSVTATLTVNNETVNSATICEGTSATLVAGGGSAFRWSTGETTASISATATGTYSVTVSNAEGCSDIASATITVNPAPVLTLNSPTVCAGQSAVLAVGGCSGTLTWSTGAQTASITVAPLVTTIYSATCALATGCSSTASSTVTVNEVPTYDANVVVTTATCTGATANNNAAITVNGIVNAANVGISAGSTYTGPTPGTVVVTNGTVRFENLPNPTAKQPYTIRLFSATGGCFTDIAVTLDPVICQCPAPVCVPIVIRKTVR